MRVILIDPVPVLLAIAPVITHPAGDKMGVGIRVCGQFTVSQ